MIETQARTEPAQSPRTGSAERTVRGLDSIRFWCALWVYFSHFGFIPLSGIVQLPRVAAGIYNNLFCGVAAVIAFFVISGFCIHYPYVGAQKIPLRAFYVRRYIRILCPLAAALFLGARLGEDITDFYQTIIWSLICELIYYTIYPLLRIALIRWPRGSMLAAYAAASVLIASFPGALNFHEFGPRMTWVVGLPSWLLGCQLATAAAAPKRLLRNTAPWIWRGGVWAASSVASALRFHANVGYPATLTLFGVLVFFWLREEIGYYRFTKPPRWSESCGRWSYSMYLVHGLAALGFARLGFGASPPLLWALQTVGVLLGSYCFYIVVESPSHRLARSMAKLAGKPDIQIAQASGNGA